MRDARIHKKLVVYSHPLLARFFFIIVPSCNSSFEKICRNLIIYASFVTSKARKKKKKKKPASRSIQQLSRVEASNRISCSI